MWKPLKKRNTTRGYLTLALLWLASWAFAQNSECGCLDNVIVSLNDDCEFVLDVSNVQAGECGEGAYVLVDDGSPQNQGIIDCPGVFNYGIFRGEEQICWGKVTAEDKRGPNTVDTITVHETLECHLIDKILNKAASTKADNKYYVGEIVFADNCHDCGCEVSRTFSDQLYYQDCDETLRTGVTAELVRTWTAIDCDGFRTQAQQRIQFIRPSLDTLRQVSDTTYQTCTPEQQIVVTRYPYWIDSFGDRIYLNEIDCDYAATIEAARFPVCDGRSYKEERYVRVFDWCAGGAVYVDTFVTKVGDFAGPIFTGNAKNIASDQVLNDLQNKVDRDSLLRVFQAGEMPSFSTGPTDCTAALSLQLQTLRRTMGFGVEECNIGYLSATIYAFERETLFGFPINDTSWVETNYVRTADIAAGLPPGIYAMEMTLSDDCKNNSTGLVYFLVEDKIAPVMKCTDVLNVSLTTASGGVFDQVAYARVDAVDIDNGSFDNCMLGQLKVRRSVSDLASCADFFIGIGYDGNGDGQIDETDWYDENNNGLFDPETEYRWVFKDGTWYTPWRDFVEFCCCDVDQEIVLELGGWDQAWHPLTGAPQPNLNYCWQTTIIEDSSVPLLTSLPTAYIECTNPLLQELSSGPIEGRLLQAVRDTFGQTEPYGIFCGSVKITERLEDYRDICGFGRIDRLIEVEKETARKGVKVATIVQEIRIQEVFSYNICFPADVDFHCTEDNISIPEVEVESMACDLFAINYTEEQFEAAPGTDACYKIFRTYQVMNWCEYDGNAPPVIVSRDWDGWNGCDTNGGARDYNVNPLEPDGDNIPGDEGICVLVRRDLSDDQRDTVYYDVNTNPYDTFPNMLETDTLEGYWWKVISGDSNPNSPFYGTRGSGCGTTGVWNNDPNDTGSNDDDDYRYGSNGFWQYTQHIKVTDGVAPTVSIPNLDTLMATDPLDCEANIDFLIEADDNCTPDLRYEIFVDINNTGISLQDRSDQLQDNRYQDQLPVGTHRIIVRVYDLCGNQATVEQTVVVKDAVAPSPICLSGLVVELMPVFGGGAALDVWATDFVASPIGDCTGQGPDLAPVHSGVQQPVVMDYSINRRGAPAVRDSTGLYVTCDDLGELVVVEVHAWDDAGNHDYCTTFIEVQDNNGFCTGESGAGIVAGHITTAEAVEVEGVELELSGGRNQILSSETDGTFQFEYLVEGHDYTLVPQLDKDHLNGISTFDLVLMSQHILGLKRFQSPYRMIAADVNRSGGITTLDLIQLRKLILNLEVAFPNNTSWRFVRADYEFPDPTDPWSAPFPEISNLNNLQGVAEVDFIAIKIGDVNYSAQPNSLYNPAPRSNEGTMLLEVEDLQMVAGEFYDLPFYANMDNIAGYQFTMELPTEVGELVSVEPILTREENFGLFKTDGKLTSAFVNVDDPGGQQHLFSLRVRAKSDARLGDHLTITSSITESEAYDFEYNTLALALKLKEQQIVYDESKLLPNFPNPFREKTTIRFYLEQAGSVEIQVQDALGRTITKIEEEFQQGYHQLPLAGSTLGETGVYYYQIKTDHGFEDRQQLILLE